VHVPETAVNEEHGAGGGKHEIGFAGQIFDVETVAEPHGMQQLPGADFGLGITTLNARHVVAALGGIMDVGQGLASPKPLLLKGLAGPFASL